MGRTWNWFRGKAFPFLHERFLPSLIFLVGVAIVGFTLALWVTGDKTTSSTVVVNSTVVGPRSSSGDTAGTSSTPASDGMRDPTSTTSVNAKTITSTPASSRPSDALFGTLLGAGLVLMLVGAYFYRITNIKFPGGEIQLAAKAAAAVAKVTTSEEQDDPQLMKAITVNVATRLAERAAVTGAAPSDAYAEQEASRVRDIVVGP
jgi:hypothetical protein